MDFLKRADGRNNNALFSAFPGSHEERRHELMAAGLAGACTYVYEQSCDLPTSRVLVHPYMYKPSVVDKIPCWVPSQARQIPSVLLCSCILLTYLADFSMLMR